jgi:hypothetical protein
MNYKLKLDGILREEEIDCHRLKSFLLETFAMYALSDVPQAGSALEYAD